MSHGPHKTKPRRGNAGASASDYVLPEHRQRYSYPRSRSSARSLSAFQPVRATGKVRSLRPRCTSHASRSRTHASSTKLRFSCAADLSGPPAFGPERPQDCNFRGKWREISQFLGLSFLSKISWLRKSRIFVSPKTPRTGMPAMMLKPPVRSGLDRVAQGAVRVPRIRCVNVAHHASDTGAHEIADRLSQVLLRHFPNPGNYRASDGVEGTKRRITP